MKRKAKPQMPQITPAQFTTQVVQLAQLYGWVVTHFRPARTAKGWRTAIQGDSGFFDIVAARGGRKIGAELKTGSGRPTPAQLRWLAEWGSDGYLWYPKDWDQIVAVFSGRI